MKFPGFGVCSVMCSVVLSLPCVAQANPWNGSWKLDQSTVKFDGAVFTVVTDAEGYTLKMGSEPGTKTVCDGKPKPAPKTAPAGTMVTCTKIGTGYEVDSSKDGKTTRKVAISVSADGKTLTRKAEMFPAGESAYTMTGISKRVSGGPGIAGVWKESDMQESQDTGVLTIAVSGDTVAFKETDTPKPIVCKLDGTEVKTGDGAMMSVKMVGPKTLKVTYKIDGKIRRVNTFELSADGKSVKETDVTPAPSASTTSMTLRKV